MADTITIMPRLEGTLDWHLQEQFTLEIFVYIIGFHLFLFFKDLIASLSACACMKTAIGIRTTLTSMSRSFGHFDDIFDDL